MVNYEKQKSWRKRNPEKTRLISRNGIRKWRVWRQVSAEFRQILL
jgi:hypothetical protein